MRPVKPSAHGGLFLIHGLLCLFFQFDKGCFQVFSQALPCQSITLRSRTPKRIPRLKADSFENDCEPGGFELGGDRESIRVH